MSASSRAGRGTAKSSVLGLGLGVGLTLGVVAWIQTVERTHRAADDLRRYARVVSGGGDLTVAEQHLDHADVGTVFQQVCGKAVSQRVDCDSRGKMRTQTGVAAGNLQRSGGQMPAGAPAGE